MIKIIDQLNKSLLVLEKAKKAHGQALDKMISQLPDGQKHMAVELLKKAKSGKVSISEILSFTGKIPDNKE